MNCGMMNRALAWGPNSRIGSFISGSAAKDSTVNLALSTNCCCSAESAEPARSGITPTTTATRVAVSNVRMVCEDPLFSLKPIMTPPSLLMLSCDHKLVSNTTDDLATRPEDSPMSPSIWKFGLTENSANRGLAEFATHAHGPRHPAPAPRQASAPAPRIESATELPIRYRHRR